MSHLQLLHLPKLRSTFQVGAGVQSGAWPPAGPPGKAATGAGGRECTPNPALSPYWALSPSTEPMEPGKVGLAPPKARNCSTEEPSRPSRWFAALTEREGCVLAPEGLGTLQLQGGRGDASLPPCRALHQMAGNSQGDCRDPVGEVAGGASQVRPWLRKTAWGPFS